VRGSVSWRCMVLISPINTYSLPVSRTDAPDPAAVRTFLEDFHDRFCADLEVLDGKAQFESDAWTRAEGGGGITRVLTDGDVFEKAGVARSVVSGDTLPPSATAHRPELAGRRWEATGWHTTARDAVGPNLYQEFKPWADRYFHLKHRNEARGVGGLFFDDFSGEGFSHAFDVMRSVDTPYGERERDFQLYRRGRYVEFNLVWDRGTLFGLQSGGRTESILMSMPPRVSWEYGWTPEPGSPEAALTEHFLVYQTG